MPEVCPDRQNSLNSTPNRARGKPIDEDELVREGEAATSWVLERQREAGIHIPSDGEQLRGVFLYVQRRMTGFSGK